MLTTSALFGDCSLASGFLGETLRDRLAFVFDVLDVRDLAGVVFGVAVLVLCRFVGVEDLVSRFVGVLFVVVFFVVTLRDAELAGFDEARVVLAFVELRGVVFDVVVLVERFGLVVLGAFFAVVVLLVVRDFDAVVRR